jgi:hypothetical protein
MDDGGAAFAWGEQSVTMPERLLSPGTLPLLQAFHPGSRARRPAIATTRTGAPIIDIDPLDPFHNIRSTTM